MFGLIILGLAIIYSIIHFVVLSFTKSYKERNDYEVTISWVGTISIFLLLLATMTS